MTSRKTDADGRAHHRGHGEEQAISRHGLGYLYHVATRVCNRDHRDVGQYHDDLCHYSGETDDQTQSDCRPETPHARALALRVRCAHPVAKACSGQLMPPYSALQGPSTG